MSEDIRGTWNEGCASIRACASIQMNMAVQCNHQDSDNFILIVYQVRNHWIFLKLRCYFIPSISSTWKIGCAYSFSPHGSVVYFWSLPCKCRCRHRTQSQASSPDILEVVFCRSEHHCLLSSLMNAMASLVAKASWPLEGPPEMWLGPAINGGHL